ncbi:MAG: sodium:calcium antiporter [Candidatus Spechtbacterales bacterium]|nr:sodium:calcium antiporter [Candidatus Spechtbacterales bacterium]
MEQIIFNTIFLIFSIYLLIRSGVHVVRSLSVIARFFNASEFTISFILMAFATSLPELAVGVNSALTDSPNISLGNILGTNIVNITLILGLIGIIAGKISVEDESKFDSTRIFSFLLVMSPVLLMFDGVLSRIDGVILLALFAWNMERLFEIRERLKEAKIVQKILSRNKEIDPKHSLEEEVEDVEEAVVSVREFFRASSIFILSTSLLVAASYAVVYSAKNLSFIFGVPEILIGLLVVGIGTSLPELVFGLQSANNGNGGMSLGNIFGSSVVNSTLILGVTSIIRPIVMQDSAIFWISAIFMGGTLILAHYMFRTKNFLVRKEAVVLVFAYVVFLITQIIIGIIQ